MGFEVIGLTLNELLCLWAARDGRDDELLEWQSNHAQAQGLDQQRTRIYLAEIPLAASQIIKLQNSRYLLSATVPDTWQLR